MTNSGCHTFSDDDVAADLPLQLTLHADWRSRSGCVPSYDSPPSSDVVCCRTSDSWQRCPWQPLYQGHPRELRLEESLDVTYGRCSSSGTYVIWPNILANGPLITYEQDVNCKSALYAFHSRRQLIMCVSARCKYISPILNN